MELTPEETLQIEYGKATKLFLESPAFTDYAWPRIIQLINQEFPKPDSVGWEEKYRHAYALVSAANTIHSMLKSSVDTAQRVEKKVTEVEPDIDLA